MRNNILSIINFVLILMLAQSCQKTTKTHEPSRFEKKAAIDPPVTYTGNYLTGIDFPVGALGGSVIRMNGKAEQCK